MTADSPLDHPVIQARLRELEQMVRNVLLDAIITVDDDALIHLRPVMADQADRLLRAELDQCVADGGLLSYEYGSVIDPLDPAGVLYVQLDMVLPSPPGEKIMIQFRMDDE